MPRLVIKNGVVTCVYDDRLHKTLSLLGDVHVERASHVEFDDRIGGWMVTFTPRFGGTVLGPFMTREHALFVEKQRLEEELGL